MKHAKSNSKKKIIIRIIIIVVAIILAMCITAASVLAYLYNKGREEMLSLANDVAIAIPSDNVIGEDGTVVSYNGEVYRLNQNLTTILCLGIDKDELGTDYGAVGTGGQADSIFLVAIDTLRSEYKVVAISRESMVDVNVYSTDGTFSETEKMQLCLAYAYGDGKDTSCQNVKKSVERLFYNIPISSYFALDCDGIAVLTDKVGAMELPVYDDDGNKTGETITITGANAENYIRSRNIDKIDSNNDRIVKQIGFVKAFASKAIEKTKKDILFPVSLFNTITDYSCTNLNASKITYTVYNAFSNSKNISIDFLSVKGKVVKGESGYAEFYPDEDALLELVLDVFYIKDAE